MKVICTTGVNKLAMPRWFDFQPTVTLFHGTSSALIRRIRSVGIKPPSEDLYVYAKGILAQYLAQIPDQYKQQVEAKVTARLHSVVNMRQDVGTQKYAGVIYLSPSKDQAATYANSYARTGGEIGSDIYRLSSIFAKECGLPDLKPIYEQGRPVVVEVEVPHEWMMTHGNLPEYKNDLESNYRMHEKDMVSWGHDTPEEFMDKSSGFEVRVAQSIPPKMIKAIHKL